MFSGIVNWLKERGILETEYQNLTKDLKWVDQRDLIGRGYAFRRRTSFVDEKCHVYWDSATYFKLGENGAPSDYHVVSIKTWATRQISFLKFTPKCLRNLLSFKKSCINVACQYNGKIVETLAPFSSYTLELSWLRFKYSRTFYKFIEEMVNGL